MKANEIRLGIHIIDVFNPKNPTERQIDFDDLAMLGNYKNHHLPFKPIPLNEERLLKFKEVKKFEDTIYLPLMNLKAEIHFEIYGKEIVSIIKSDFAELILDPVKYIHQLQNLYFALTNEELTLKA